MNFLSTNIKFLRQKNNLTQEDISKIVNKSRVLVSQWEADERDITTEDIIKLSDYFNVSMDTLVGKDLRIKDNVIDDEYSVLFDKYKTLSKDDKELIKNIIETRRKQIDEQLSEDNQG